MSQGGQPSTVMGDTSYWPPSSRGPLDIFPRNEQLPLDQRLPPRTGTLPVPAEPSHPHRILHDLINFAHYSRGGKFTSTAHATVLRQLFQSIWYRSEWLPYFHLTPEDISRIPGSKNLSDWLWIGENGFEKGWKLSEAQQPPPEASSSKRKGKTCSRILQRFERSYSCRTCANDPSCVLCVDCFQASEHEGHEVVFGQSFSFAAACDCGDRSAWKEGATIGCSKHPPIPPGEEVSDPPLGYVTKPEVPASLIKALHTTIVLCLEFIIDSMQYSPLPSNHSDMPKDIEQMRNDIHDTGEIPPRRANAPWSVVLWGDEKHVLKEVARQTRDALGCPWDTAEYMAKEADEMGRKCVHTTLNAVLAFHVASLYQQIDLPVTLRLAADTFKEEVAGVLITWIRDMCASTIAGDPDLFKRLVARAMSEPRIMRGVAEGCSLSPDLQELNPWNENLPESERYARYGFAPSRLDWFMKIDTRFWRKAKWDLRQIYATMYGLDWNTKKQLACRFAVNYVTLFEHYLFHDRELDTNLIFSIAYMVFGHPKASAYATEHNGLLDTILSVCVSLYANPKEGSLLMPPVPVERIDTRSSAFRSKKAMTIFGHIRVLFRHAEVQKLVMKYPSMIQHAMETVHLFVGIQCQKRVLDEHIEYEIDWPRSFAILADLCKCCREIGAAYQYSSPTFFLNSIHTVAKQIGVDMNLESRTLDSEKFSKPTFHLVKGVLNPDQDQWLIDENVATIKAFSFHHYLHFILAEMTKQIPHVLEFDENGHWLGKTLTDVWEHVIIGSTNAAEELDRDEMEARRLLVLEWPLTMHVILCQIRADMWRKNGNSMRGQYHHFREIGIRDATIDQEFFLLQVGLCTMDPLKFLVMVIDRFGLAEWFKGIPSDKTRWDESDMDPKHVILLMEDLVMLFMHLVTDTQTINAWDADRITRTHLVHQLCLTKLTYAELVKKVPERPMNDRSILHVLKQVADFKEPTDTALGTYHLKDECYDEVDPYWRHYTRNDQRAAAAKLIERAKKANPSFEPLLLPRPLEIPAKPRLFSTLGDFLHSDMAADIVYWVIAQCFYIGEPRAWPGLEAAKNEAPQLENLLDLALQFALMAIAADPVAFSYRSIHVQPGGGDTMSLFQHLWYMQSNDAFKGAKPKLDYLIDAIVKQLPEDYTFEYRSHRESEAYVQEGEQSKAQVRAQAAARQKQLMAEFAKKQADFAAFMDEDDEDEGAEMEDIQEQQTYGQCIVCQEDVSHARPGGMLALLQPSKVLRDVVHSRDWFEESLSAPVCMDNATRYPRFGLGSAGDPSTTDGYPANHTRFGVYVSACSHVMHDICLGTYFEATKYRHTMQVGRHHPENAVRMEYMCPLCKSLGNILIPLDPTTTRHRPITPAKGGGIPSLSEKIRSVSEEGLIRVSDSSRIWDYHVETGELTPWFTDCSFSMSSLDPQHRRQNMKSTSRMIERMRNLLRPLSEQSTRIRGKQLNMYLPDDMVAYTIGVCEIAQRGLPRPVGAKTVAEQIPETNARLIKQLIGALQLELDLFFGPQYDRTALRVGLFARFLPDWYRASTLPSPLLLRNPLGMVVETAAIAPDLLHPVINMAYYATLTRVTLGLCIYIRRCLIPRVAPQPRSEPVEEHEKADALEVFSDIRSTLLMTLRNAGPFTDVPNVLSLVTDEQLAKLLYAFTLPFLRRAAIIYYTTTSTYPDPKAADNLSISCEYRRLMALLAIPMPQTTLKNLHSTETPIVARWLTQWALQGRYVPPLEFPGTYELFRLPEKWETMVLQYINQRCERCGTKPTFPAVCLFCGTLVCLGGDCCADGDQGECNLHMRECGAAVGMFVDIKRWVILYLYAGSGSFSHMPYLDTHGELDISMRRGHRQYIHIGRFNELRKATWLQHGIPHLTARKLEVISDGGGWGCM